ncbi:MAG TPA: Gfo/Idh/MocA family oxidoreductase [Cyclobacteriaceae bacterium]
MNIIKTGLISFGTSGSVFHAPFIYANQKFELTKVLERHHQKSKERYPNVTVVRELDDILSDDSIELVVVTTPNEYHYEMAKKALVSGKHVIIEKPFTVKTEEADELIALSKRHQKLLTVYHNRRLDSDFKTIQHLIINNVLGSIHEFESRFDRYRNYRKGWKDEDKPGSGILYDLGSHLIDQALILFGMPIALDAEIKCQRKISPVDDYFEINLYYQHLKVILKASMLIKEPTPRFSVFGDKGSFIKYGLDPQEARLKKGFQYYNGIGIEEETLHGLLHTTINAIDFRGHIKSMEGDYMAFYENVSEVIRNGAEPLIKPEEIRSVIWLIEQAYRSNKEKTRITI